MASRYRIQIIDLLEGGAVHDWAPGLPAERDFVEEVVARVEQRPVGMLRTRAQVAAEVRLALHDLLWDMKLRVKAG